MAAPNMENTDWIAASLGAITSYIEYQMRASRQVGCSVSIAHRGTVILERAFGVSDLSSEEPLTSRHRFRVASHSKTFTAAGILKLREQGRVGLDDKVGNFVPGLHPDIAAATISQLLSHAAGLVRDGPDGGQFADTRPYLARDEVLSDLSSAPPIPAGLRMKYSNHGFALLCLVIEAITGESYIAWIDREVVQAAVLLETSPDAALLPGGTTLARGHTGYALLGERRVIPADNPSFAMAFAAGFISTSSDLAKFFTQLDPAAESSFLSKATRREMTRRHWKIEHITPDQYYGLGTCSGTVGSWGWFGHGGAFQGILSKTSVVSSVSIAASLIVNSLDGSPDAWVEGIFHIMQAYQKYGPPSPITAHWSGRFSNIWATSDLLVVGGRKVLIAWPGVMNPLVDAVELEVDVEQDRSGDKPAGTVGDHAKITKAAGYGSFGEEARLVRNDEGKVVELWLGSSKNLPEKDAIEDAKARYPKGSRAL